METLIINLLLHSVTALLWLLNTYVINEIVTYNKNYSFSPLLVLITLLFLFLTIINNVIGPIIWIILFLIFTILFILTRSSFKWHTNYILILLLFSSSLYMILMFVVSIAIT